MRFGRRSHRDTGIRRHRMTSNDSRRHYTADPNQPRRMAKYMMHIALRAQDRAIMNGTDPDNLPNVQSMRGVDIWCWD